MEPERDIYTWVDACVCNLYQALFWPSPPPGPNFESLGTRLQTLWCNNSDAMMMSYLVSVASSIVSISYTLVMLLPPQEHITPIAQVIKMIGQTISTQFLTMLMFASNPHTYTHIHMCTHQSCILLYTYFQVLKMVLTSFKKPCLLDDPDCSPLCICVASCSSMICCDS